MIDIDFQKDLFGEQVCEEKARKPRLLCRYSERRFLPYVKIPIEYIVIIVIGMLVLTVIAYAVGVEKGRNTAGAKIGRDITIEQTENAIKVETEEPATSTIPNELVYKPLEEDTSEILRENEKINDDFSVLLEKETEKQEQVHELYTIQLASFKKEELAKKELQKLKKENITADVTKKGEWYQVYAVGYHTIEEANKAKEELLKEYKDCYIRRVK